MYVRQIENAICNAHMKFGWQLLSILAAKNTKTYNIIDRYLTPSRDNTISVRPLWFINKSRGKCAVDP